MVSRKAVLETSLEQLKEHLEGDEKALELLEDIRSLCFGENI